MKERFRPARRGGYALCGRCGRRQPASFEGRFYRLEEAGYRSQPEAGRPPILIGGAGERRTLRIAAEHADEWNCVTVTEPEGYAHKVRVLEQHCEDVGRDSPPPPRRRSTGR